MILRRVINHFRKQEWTAIAIDFVIVVLGVFVANQVTVLNQQRLERRAEAELIVQLRADVAAAIAELQKLIEWLGPAEEHDDAVRDLAARFYGDQQVAVAEDICGGIGMLSNINNPVRPLAGIEEIVSGGALSRITDRRLNALISDYHDFKRYTDQQFARYTDLLTPLDVEFPQYFATEAYWEEKSQSIRIRGQCNAGALLADPAFKARLARQIDYHDSWATLFIATYGQKLAALQAALDVAAKARGITGNGVPD